MKSIAATCLMLTLGASVVCAEDIKGKWGVGAGVFGGGGEVSLIHGKSAQSAWLFDVSMANFSSAEESDPGSSTTLARNDDNVAMRVGPGYRGYMRATEALSPYWDLAAHFLYNRSHSHNNTDGLTNQAAGGDAVLSFGLEYFTPWHFSIAGDSEILGFSWTHDTRNSSSGTTTASSTGHTQRASLRLSPVLYVRGYF